MSGNCRDPTARSPSAACTAWRDNATARLPPPACADLPAERSEPATTPAAHTPHRPKTELPRPRAGSGKECEGLNRSRFEYRSKQLTHIRLEPRSARVTIAAIDRVLSRETGKAPARFFDQNLERREIPRLRARLHPNVGLALCH